MTLSNAAPQRAAVAEDTRLSRIVLVVIGGLIVVRLLFASVIGLSYDEAVLAVKARHPRWSYFDHPPLASLMIAAVQALTGSDAVTVLRLPAILLFGGTTWLVFRIGALLFNPLAGFCGAIALVLSPMFGFYLGVLAVTDAPLLFCIAAAALCLCHALFGGNRTTLWWLGAGLFAGLALLSKSLSAGLVILGLLGFLLTSPRQRYWLARPAPYFAAALMLTIMAPIFIWNAQNEWVGLSFPGGHPISGDWSFQHRHPFWSEWTFQPLRVLTYFGVQALILLPWIWLGLIAALIWGFARGPQSDPTWLLAWLAAVPLACFALVSLLTTHRKGFHWTAPGYLLLFPLLGALIERALRRHFTAIVRLAQATVIILAVAAVVVIGHIVAGLGQRLIPQLQQRSDDPIAADLVSWDALSDAVGRHRTDATTFVVGLRWEDCAKIEVGIRMAMPVLCATPFPEIFAYLVDPRPLIGQDAIIVARDGQNVPQLLSAYFERIEPLDSVVITHFRTRARVLDLYRGRNLRAVYPWPYGPYRAPATPAAPR